MRLNSKHRSGGAMYQRIVVPLDGSIVEVEGVIARAQDMLDPEGEAILLQVVPSGEHKAVGQYVKFGLQVERDQRSRAMGYLKYFAAGLNKSSDRWNCEVIVADSVVEGIVDFAIEEQADLIAMYTHNRQGLAKLVGVSAAEEVRARAPMEVLEVGPRDLVVP